ncbi:retinal short-chain dehydrogenase reductase [Fusarium tjaetaba]|uniref:Short-chain dehydrogenase/reductase 3 n=1 Tax=Fusarium tjaetaba TaxID=1567544 RepID=A0A8H5R0J6_9HYPO|nr:retinal short-chain dehydrogenase reductase [Fusarium tjaetaba]KAF5624253.1 retinal short-chain dehydrogenase reductase [Fusarium tjaetaba]
MLSSKQQLTAVLLMAGRALGLNFTISNGQIFTPGFVVLDAPQPNTPLGGDVTANGKLPLPPYDEDDDNQIFSIEMFLYSYMTGRNLTISNGTATANNVSLGEIMAQEPGSTVKHINWLWPDCLVGDGKPEGDSDRGVYNISIRQNFRLNGDDHYTIFDVPINVTNLIPEDGDRPSCAELSNDILSPEEIDAEAANEVGVLFAPGDSTELEASGEDSKGSDLDSKLAVYAGLSSLAQAKVLFDANAIMPIHQGLIPREGFCADVVLRLVRQTALNPALLFPLVLFARLTKKGQDLSILHPNASSHLKTLFYVALARWASGWWSDKTRNNWADDKYDWKREVVLVTGGAGGIGGRIVKLFEEMGVKVVVLDVQPMSFEVSANVHYFQCDLRSPENVEAVAEKIRAEVGHPTVVINVAGVVRGKTILESQPSDIRFTFDVNTFAPFWIAKTFVPDMVAKNHGMVVTLTSYASWLTIPNLVDYGASKAAALAFHEGLTAELTTRYNAPKVRTVIVHPGPTNTALFKGYYQNTDFLMPPLAPESVADAVVRQVLTGRSGHVVIPGTGTILAALRMQPDWYAIPVRAKAEAYMKNFSGRQVIEDVDTALENSGEEKEADENATASTVLVS